MGMWYHLCHFFCFSHICALLVTFSIGQDLTNVALNKPASQSSYHPSFGRPQNIVDGNKGTSVGVCTHTADVDSKPERWWRVDLQGMYDVYTIVITNRGDCCGFRLRDFDVQVARSLSRPDDSWQDSSTLCLHHNGQVADGATVSLDCSQPISGRYVTLAVSTSTDPLNLCELEVLGVPSLLVSRWNTYLRHPGQRAQGNILRHTYAKSVIHCTSTCAEESECTAVNLQDSGMMAQKDRRICQLLAFDDTNLGSLLTATGWNFYRLNITTESYL